MGILVPLPGTRGSAKRYMAAFRRRVDAKPGNEFGDHRAHSPRGRARQERSGGGAHTSWIVPIFGGVGIRLQDFAETAAFDYDQTHKKSRLPLEIRDIHWLLAHWEKGLATQDSPRQAEFAEPLTITGAAIRLSEALKKLDEQHASELDDAGLADPEGRRYERSYRLHRTRQ